MKRLFIVIGLFVQSTFSFSQNALLDSVELAMSAEYSDLSEALKNPDQVIKLVLRKQGLKKFPEEIYSFKNLQFLDLSKNKIKVLPDSIVKLKQLKYLIVSKTDLEALPNTIGKLKSLKYFNANQNRIARLPYSFGELENLEVLDMWDNELDYFPETLVNLKNLKEFDLRNILISQDNQDNIQAMLPDTKIHFSPACKCAW